MKTLHIRIADEIGYKMDWFGLIPGFTANELEWRLVEMPNPEKIVLHISSPGGDVEEGLAIYNRLCELRESGIIIGVVVESHCYSIATLIAMCASPGELLAREASLWCQHKPMYPEIYYANADDLREYASKLDSCESAINSAYVRRSGKTVAEVEAVLRLDTIISAGEAVKNGWIDGTIESSPAEKESAKAKATALKPVAFVGRKSAQLYFENNKSKTMEGKNKETGKTVMQKLTALAKNIIALSGGDESGTDGGVENATTKLKDGTEIHFTGELETGTKVFTDAAMETPLADGSHKLEDGRTIVVANGTGEITEIEDAEADTTASAAKDKEIADLKAEVADLKKVNAENAQALKMVDELSKEVAKMKNFVPGSGDSSPKGKQIFANTDSEKPNKGGALSANVANLKSGKK